MAGRPAVRAEWLDEQLVAAPEELDITEAFASVECKVHSRTLSECRTCLSVVANHSEYDDLSEEAVRLLEQGKTSRGRGRRSAKRNSEGLTPSEVRKAEQKQRYLSAKAEYDETGEVPEGWYLRESVRNPGNFYLAEKEAAPKGAASKAKPKASTKTTKPKASSKPKATKGRREVRKSDSEHRITMSDSLRQQQENIEALIELAAKDPQLAYEKAIDLGIKMPSRGGDFRSAKALDEADLAAEEAAKHKPPRTDDEAKLVVSDENGIALSRAEVEKRLKDAGLKVTASRN